MKKNICTFFLLFNALFLFGQSTYKQNLADLASINFPQKPATSDTLGHSVAQVVDSIAIYSVLSKSYDQDKLLFNKDKLYGFYDGTIEGFIDAAQGKLINKKPFEIDGLKGIEIEFSTTANPNLPDLRFVRMLLLNNTLITVNFWTFSENKQATETSRRLFFNSLAITADKTALTQGIDSPAAYLVGSLIGKLFAWAIVLGVIAGIILLIRRITRKRKAISKAEF